ncbi:MAG TPA: proline dehydrogenase family protein, partial [Bacteroidales bacterium]|nr:proline dehydrogenase family protein [Bacteroidales bacterium]
MITFDNTEIAFSIRTDAELRRARLLYKLISLPWLVKLGNSMISFMASVGLPVNWIVKPTVYKQFVGGETISECIPVVQKLAAKGVKSILDYSVEGKEEDDDIELALEETLRAIDFAGKNPDVPFAVFKPTAFIRSGSLEILGSGATEIPAAVQADGNKFRERINRLCMAALERGLPIMIDAEDVVFQNFIDKVVYEMQKKYNTDKPVVYNTYQMYRRDRLDILKEDYARALKEGFYLGAKFVRGAYMERERARAEKLGYPDPIHPDKAATDKAYNDALAFSLQHLDRISIFNGTHNEYSSSWL